MIHQPLIWGLTLLDLCVLLGLGLATSAAVWVLTEVAKERSPAFAASDAVRWFPMALDIAATGVLFPPALHGVAPDHTMPYWLVWLLVPVLGTIGGYGAREAHDRVRGLLDRLFGAAARFLGNIGT